MVRPPVQLVSVFVLLVAVIVAMSGSAPESAGGPRPGVLEGAGGWESGPGSPALVQARRMLAEGDADGAAAAARSLVGHAPQTDAAARLLLARALMAMEDTKVAADVLTQLLDAGPSDQVAAAAYLARGSAREAMGDTDLAIGDYRQAAARDPSIEAYARLRLVDLFRATGKVDEAEREAREVADGTSIRRTQVAALEALREMQSERGDGAGYLATTRRLLDIATLPVYRAQLTYEAGQAELLAGRRAAAIRDLHAVVSSAPETLYAVQALDTLVELNAADSLPPAERGLVLYHAGRDLDAIEQFTRALEADPARDEARYYRGLSRARAGNVAGGVEDLREVARRTPDSGLAARALEQAGWLLEEAGDPDAARALYQEVIARYPSTDAAAEARFRVGFMSFVARDFGAALTTWAEGGDARVLFWLGKAREVAGDHAAAQASWEAAARSDPNGYYGLRAAALLDGEAQPASTPAVGTGGHAPWRDLAPWFEERGVDPLAERAAVEAESGLRRALILLDAGFTQEAGWEIDALVEANDGLPERLVALAGVLAARGEEASASMAVAPLVDPAEAGHRPVPTSLERLRYPIPYHDILFEAAQRYEVDPLLLAALVRQESGFNPEARSPVGALGLAQIMPETGREIAHGLGRAEFQPDDLLKPEVNLEFGAVYLAERLRRYDGHLFAALAAYNAGDTPVTEWLAAPGADDPDVFTEMIPYPETHDYVRRVYTNYQHFRRLYAPATGH